MRDLVAREALRTMAADAARRLQALVADGAEIPYELQGPNEGSPICQYVPLTERFVRDHAAEIRSADSFGVACAALESAGLSTPYLEEFGIAVPASPDSRGELAAIVFLCRLWMDATEFSVDRHRVDTAIEEMESCATAGRGDIQVVVVLRGFQAATSRIELEGAQIVRADHYDDPPQQALAADGAGVAGWEPPYLAVVSLGDMNTDADDPGFDPAGEALATFDRLISALRLFKPGGVALGPHAWLRVANGSWQRMNTGATRARASGYRLADSEAGDFADFAARFERYCDGLDAGTPLARAIVRFETGLDRETPLDTLNDFLISLRSLFEGGGPARLGFAQRLAAVTAPPSGRESVRRKVERAVALERDLWSGAGSGPTPGLADSVGEIEDLLRQVLAMAISGNLGDDLRTVADEILLADGLGMSARPEPATAPAPAPAPAPEIVAEVPNLAAAPDTGEFDVFADDPGPDTGEFDVLAEDDFAGPAPFNHELPTREMKVFAPERRSSAIKQEAHSPAGSATSVKEKPVLAEARYAVVDAELEPEPELIIAPRRQQVIRLEDEVPAVRSSRPASDIVRRLMADRAAQRAEVADRVAGLFPRPEPTQWNVRELDIERAVRRPLASGRYA